jgi:hypothetical protein
MRIIRHTIAIHDYQIVELPNDGMPLSVALKRDPAEQEYMLDLWTLDYEAGEPKTLGIYVVGTGNPMPDELDRTMNPHSIIQSLTVLFPNNIFIGTVVTPRGRVWHTFTGAVRDG